ncbi:MAG TPA: site-2 protease family protein [Actinomycetota bacterium]|nr:site-2 protease family protein [Actinomycetota bacterium]
MESSITLFRVRGVEIGVNWSWIFIFVLIAWSLGSALFPATYPRLSAQTYLVMGVVAALLFFGSVLLHELAHAFVGIHEGAKIEGITLWLLGGVARFSGTPGSPGGEFRMTIVGPLTSLGLGAVFLGVAAVGDAADWPAAVRGVADYLGRINLILAAFNLVPALPLDGGRVLRAWLWHRQGSFEAATVTAARAGRLFGWLLITIAVLGLLTGAGIGGLWFALLGWFLLQASQAEATQGVLQSVIRGRRVEDLMTPDPETVDADLDVGRLADLASGPGGRSVYPVVDGDRLVGLVSLRAVAASGADPSARVRDVMIPSSELRTVRRTDWLSEGLEALQAGGGRVLVVDDGRVEGMLSAADVARAIEARRLRAEPPRPARAAGLLVWVMVVAIMLLVGGYLYHPPLVVIEPQDAIDITRDVEISGVEVEEITGRYLVTPVGLSQPNALGALVAAFDPARDVVSTASILPTDAGPGFAREQREVFRQSRELAAAAAATEAGFEISMDGSGAVVVDVVDGSPAARLLQAEDVVISIDGRPVEVASDLRAVLTSSPPGTTFRLEIERGGSRTAVDVSTERIATSDGSIIGIGVLLTTRGLSVDLPFEVRFAERNVGGASAGLAYALVVSDLLGNGDLADGRTIAATGAIEVGGEVGPVGGMASKLRSAEDAGADVFLVPGNAVVELDAETVEISGVSDLAGALRLLRS